MTSIGIGFGIGLDRKQGEGDPNEITLNFTVVPEGGGTVSPNPWVGQNKTNGRLTAVPSPGYVFDHWEMEPDVGSGSVSPNNPETFWMKEGREITAFFVREQDTLLLETGDDILLEDDESILLEK